MGGEQMLQPRGAQGVGVLLVDHYRVVREGLRAMIEGRGGVRVVGEAGSVCEAVSEALHLGPELVLCGVELPDGCAVDLIRSLGRSMPQTRTVVFSPIADEELFFQAVAAGAAGFLVQDVDTHELVTSLCAVGAGESLITAEAIDSLRARSRQEVCPSRLTRDLTGQEARILSMVVEGQTNGEIAGRLSLAEKTVRNYMSSILAKTGSRNRTELTAAVVRSSAPKPPRFATRVITLPQDVRTG
jgi:two-component system, NarL family, response regulator DevR